MFTQVASSEEKGKVYQCFLLKNCGLYKTMPIPVTTLVDKPRTCANSLSLFGEDTGVEVGEVEIVVGWGVATGNGVGSGVGAGVGAGVVPGAGVGVG
jgi:hypothetical protein